MKAAVVAVSRGLWASCRALLAGRPLVSAKLAWLSLLVGLLLGLQGLLVVAARVLGGRAGAGA